MMSNSKFKLTENAALSQSVDLDTAYALHKKARVSRGRRVLLDGKLRKALILQAILNPPYK